MSACRAWTATRVLAQVTAVWPAISVVVRGATGFTNGEQRALAGGARAFFAKPARYDASLTVVRGALGFARTATSSS